MGFTTLASLDWEGQAPWTTLSSLMLGVGSLMVTLLWRLWLVFYDAAYMFLYREASVAPLLDMRRRFKAVMECSWMP